LENKIAEIAKTTFLRSWFYSCYLGCMAEQQN